MEPQNPQHIADLRLSRGEISVEEHQAISRRLAESRAVPSPARGGPAAVVLEWTGDRKIEVIKAVREITGLGLKDSKELVESTPALVLDGVDQARAEDAARRIRAAGATARAIAADSPEARTAVPARIAGAPANAAAKSGCLGMLFVTAGAAGLLAAFCQGLF
ncbi:MAG: hypothetical protein GC160_16780 [Acidobacteria bacterium]|nr:hypothetical protein [Acidobacteriota bacterium]